MDHLNSGYLQLGLVALAFGGLQIWWISSTIRKRDLARPLSEKEFRRSLEQIWARQFRSTFALERGVPIATVCNNCDTSIEYIQQNYFNYVAKRATGALATGRRGLKAAVGKD